MPQPAGARGGGGGLQSTPRRRACSSRCSTARVATVSGPSCRYTSATEFSSSAFLHGALPARARLTTAHGPAELPVLRTVTEVRMMRRMLRRHEKCTTSGPLTLQSPDHANRSRTACAAPGRTGGLAPGHAIKWRPRLCLPLPPA